MAKVKYAVWKRQTDAVTEFTDREDPQEAFERKLRVLSNNWKEEYYVLCYYGIGGIGKTSFTEKLRRVIRGVEGNAPRLLDKINCDYIQYDFKDTGTDKISILLSFRKQLTAVNPDFKFFRFDSAMLLCAKKTGNNIEKDENAQSFLESSPWLDVVVSTMGMIPGVSLVSSIIQAIDKSTKVAKESIKKHMDQKQYQEHLKKINELEPKELVDNLHNYFVLDMQYNMLQVATKPLIVFLDTYENFVDTLNIDRDMIVEDHWLRKGEQSLIRSIPGVLWVITGREKLYWNEDDTCKWEELSPESPLAQMNEEEKELLARTDLEQHLLGDLSLKDAASFLKKTGIENDTFCAQLYKLTNGTPLYLDMCVNTYYELRNQGIQPEIEMFGNDLTELVNRYLLNMNDANREMAYYLACLGSWNDEIVQKIGSESEKLRWYKFSKYQDFISNSFIIKNPNGTYYMHETVRKAILKKADNEIRDEISRLHLSVARKSLDEETTLSFNEKYTNYINILTKTCYPYEVFYQNVKETLQIFRNLDIYGSYDLLYTSTKEVFNATIKNYPETVAEYIMRSEYGRALCLKGCVKKALDIVTEKQFDYNEENMDSMYLNCIMDHITTIYDANGMYKEALELCKQTVESKKKYLGQENPATILSMNNLAALYIRTNDTQSGLELYKQILDKMKQIQGEKHPETLIAMNNLAYAYNQIGSYQEALNLHEKIFEIRKQTLGDENPNTLLSMNNLAVSYSNKQNYPKATELFLQTLEIQKKVLGEEHPDTIRTMNNLALVYAKKVDFPKENEIYKQTWPIMKRVLGEDHPDTLKVKAKLDRYRSIFRF